MTKDPNDLLNPIIMTNLLLKYTKDLNLTNNFKITNITRNMALSPNTYTVLYRINDQGQEKLYRGNSSISQSRLNSFETIKALNKSFFNNRNYRLPEDYIFDVDYNLLLYRDIPGVTLKNKLKEGLSATDMQLCAQWLSRLHKSRIALKLNRYNLYFDIDDLIRYYPDLVSEIENIKKQITKNKNNNEFLVHGDYQLNNIIINNDKIWVIDFNDSCCDNPMTDVASFIAQLRAMSFIAHNFNNYEMQRKSFLGEYRKDNPIIENDLKLYEKLFYIKILASLCASLPENDSKKKEILETIYKWYNEP